MGHPGAYLLSTAELDVEDVDGETPLYVAAGFGHRACCAALIAAGANTEKAAKDGSTPLSVAAYSGHASVCKLLASRGADLLATNAQGFTVIHRAAFHGHADVVKVLLPHLRVLGIVDLRTIQAQKPGRVFGHAALHFAFKNGHHLVAKRLLAAGASRTSTTSDGFTPLHYATQPFMATWRV